MPKLRVIAPGHETDAPEIPMAEAVDKVVKECLADSPAVVFMAWESRGKMTCRTLPDSVMVQKGFVHTLYEILFEDGDLEDED